MFSMPGKINFVQMAQLDVHLSAGCMANFQDWRPYTNDNNSCEVNILFDNVVIYHGNVSMQGVKFHYEFEDDNSSHEFRIELIDVPDPVFELENEYHHMLKIDGIWLEQLNLRNVMEDLADSKNNGVPVKAGNFIGEPGYQSLTFTTPVYRWLLDHQIKPSYYYN
jgi:hypothetical protein